MSGLFDPIAVGPLVAPNRMVMSPMTRARADPEGVPTPLNALYYAQRASAGFIITESTQISPTGSSVPGNPGIFSTAQVEGWRQTTQAVHAAGGRIFLQLWHVGRLSHPTMQPGGAPPIAPSAIRAPGEARTPFGKQPRVTPRALETDEVSGVVDDYRAAARNAQAAGFDGVEIHAANGFLIEQFLRESANVRTDRYGGGVINRSRFLMEVVQAVVDVWGPGRVGVRISPNGSQKGIWDSDPRGLFAYVVAHLNRFELAYLHIIERLTDDVEPDGGFIQLSFLRPLFRGVIIANGGYDKARAEQTLLRGDADLISFGQPFIANPDLVERLRRDLPLTPVHGQTVYGGEAEGYTDYQRWNEGGP